MKKIFFIQKIIGAAVMIAAMILLTDTTAYGQVCAINAAGNCVGACPPLYNGNGTVAGNPACEKVKDKCKCTTLDIVTHNCTLVGGKCKGNCDPLYRSIGDAAAGKNPIQGKCQPVPQSGATVCACRYKL